MTGFANSTIAALCYAEPTEMDFPSLTAEFGKALWANPQGQLDIRNTYDDFVVFDLATMRITIAYTNLHDGDEGGDTPPAFAECIVVAIGPGPDGNPPGPGFEDRALLCQGLVDRISAHRSADRLIVREHPGVFDPDAHDAMVEEIATPRGQALKRRPDPVTEELMWELASKAWDRAGTAGPEIIDAEELDIQPPRPTHPPAAADRRGAAAKRRARPRRKAPADEHAEPQADVPWDEDIDSQPLVHRAAVNSLNAAMLVFALPVGAALITLSILGRESLGVSSRITAVTGSVIGVANTEAAQNLLSFLG